MGYAFFIDNYSTVCFMDSLVIKITRKKQKVFSLSRGQFFKFRKEFIKKHRSMEVIFEELFGSNSQIFADVEKDSQ